LDTNNLIQYFVELGCLVRHCTECEVHSNTFTESQISNLHFKL